MTELSRSLLTAAREGLAPDEAAAARVRARVAAAIAASTATTATSAKAHAAGSTSLLKLAAALVLVGLVSTIIVAIRSDRTPEAPRLSVVSSDGDEALARVHVAAPDDPLVLPDEPQIKRGKPAAPGRATLPSREPASLSREVELIDLAMVSLRKNAPLAAIEAIRVFERETFGEGQMAEEAAAIEIEAHCVLRDDVTAALARFDRTWPESAQRERIQTTCFSGSKR